MFSVRVVLSLKIFWTSFDENDLLINGLVCSLVPFFFLSSHFSPFFIWFICVLYLYRYFLVLVRPFLSFLRFVWSRSVAIARGPTPKWSGFSSTPDGGSLTLLPPETQTQLRHCLLPLQYYEAPPALADILAYMNLIFTMLFSLECILKLAAFGIKVHSCYLRLLCALHPVRVYLHTHTPQRFCFWLRTS